MCRPRDQPRHFIDVAVNTNNNNNNKSQKRNYFYFINNNDIACVPDKAPYRSSRDLDIMVTVLYLSILLLFLLHLSRQHFLEKNIIIIFFMFRIRI
jgi:hypothetical protein